LADRSIVERFGSEHTTDRLSTDRSTDNLAVNRASYWRTDKESDTTRLTQKTIAERLESEREEKTGLFSNVSRFFKAHFFHSGGVVGQTSDVRTVFDEAPRYHSGGIVSKIPGLKANEVPAVLLGGPKGIREEVLTAKDPRHKDNIAPQLLAQIQSGQKAGLSFLAGAAGASEPAPQKNVFDTSSTERYYVDKLVQHDKATREVSPLTRYLMGSPETVRSLIRELSKESDHQSVSALREIQSAGKRALGGPVSANTLYRVNENGPELLQVAGKQYLMTGQQGGAVKAMGSGSGGMAPQTNIKIEGAPPVEKTERRKNNTGGEDVFIKFKDRIKNEMYDEARNGEGMTSVISQRAGFSKSGGLIR
jgi:hypothetical protein